MRERRYVEREEHRWLNETTKRVISSVRIEATNYPAIRS